MPYGFVGSQVSTSVSGSTVTVDFSGIAIASGDVAYVLALGGGGVPHSVDFTTAGWTMRDSAMLRGNGSTLQVEANLLQKTLAGTETTQAFTDSGGLAPVMGAFLVVYRGLNPVAITRDNNPSNASTLLTPQTDVNPNAVVCTAASISNTLGATRQQLIYIYWDFRSPGPTTVYDSALTARVSHYFAGPLLLVEWFDEIWESSAALPSRAVQSVDLGDTSVHYGILFRIRPNADQSIAVESAGGDAWAWVG